MLIKNFYTVLKSESPDTHSILATVEIEKEHSIFKGHFPDFPVTPGVGMLQILKELTEKHLGLALFLESASNVKFLTLVNPHENGILNFHISYQDDGDRIKVKNSTTFTDGTSVLKCNVTFAKC